MEEPAPAELLAEIPANGTEEKQSVETSPPPPSPSAPAPTLPPIADGPVFPTEPPVEKVPEKNPIDPNTGKPKRGRPKKQVKPPDFSDIIAGFPTDNEEITEGGQSSETPKKVDYKALSGMFFDIGTNSLATAFGPEWLPTSKGEREGVVIPLAVYLESKEITDIPPGVMLCIVLTAYAAPRTFHDNTRGKLAKMFDRMKHWLGRIVLWWRFKKV